MSFTEPITQILAHCDEVQDAEEETFELFSQQIPSSNLGFVDAKATAIDLEIGKTSFSISQSPGLLHSDRSGGTTGAVLWKVTPLVAQWLNDRNGSFWKNGVLDNRAVIAELGCGVSGLIGLALHDHVGQYILSDQAYVMKSLRQNIGDNIKQKSRKGKKPSGSASGQSSNLHLLPFDWEVDSAENFRSVAGDKGIDLVIACDCIYNDFLVGPFVQACREVCQLRSTTDGKDIPPTLLLVAQQLRSDEVFDRWLKETMKYFTVWRASDTILPPSLKAGNGYIVHLAVLKQAS